MTDPLPHDRAKEQMTTLAKQLKELRAGDEIIRRDGMRFVCIRKSSTVIVGQVKDKYGSVAEWPPSGKGYDSVVDIVRVIKAKKPRAKKVDADVAWLLNFAKWPFGYTKRTQTINRNRLRAIAKRLSKETT